MRAIIRKAYGSPEVLSLRDIERPAVGAGDVLVRVHACSINASDWEFLTGSEMCCHVDGSSVLALRRGVALTSASVDGSSVAEPSLAGGECGACCAYS